MDLFESEVSNNDTVSDNLPVVVSDNNSSGWTSDGSSSQNDVSVNTVSFNLISADGLSLNSVSVNVSNNYVSSCTIVSADSTPFWDKPFKNYTTSEGILFCILITMTLGFL